MDVREPSFTTAIGRGLAVAVERTWLRRGSSNVPSR
jgi:hypothetical protein